jgi:hypothetical protein
MLAVAAYRLLLGEIARGTEDNNDSVVLELDGAVKPSASMPGASSLLTHCPLESIFVVCCRQGSQDCAAT